MKKELGRLTMAVALALTMVAGSVATAPPAYAEQMQRVNLELKVDGGKPVTVKGYYASYPNNLYLSMRDICSALSGTSKEMNLKRDRGGFAFDRGQAYVPVGGENEPFEVTWAQDPKHGTETFSYDVPIFYLDGQLQEWRVYFKSSGAGEVYMRPLDVGMAFDLNLTMQDASHVAIDTEKPFTVDIEAMKKEGYFDIVRSVLVGNAETGEILFATNRDVPIHLASTSKLMTFLLVQEAIERGDLGLDTMVTIEKDAVAEASGEDGTFQNAFTEGKEMSVQDLLAGLLLPSANECGTALAHAVAGSEPAFVERMNERAAELGLKTAKFFNPHGLPHYGESINTPQQENMMSVGEMFKLVRYIVNHYGEEVTAFTSKESIAVPSFGAATSVNSTYTTMLRNMGCTGLKTGYTGHAGYCFVGLLPIEVNGETQHLISLVYGATSNLEKFEKSMVLLHYGRQYYANTPGIWGDVLSGAGLGVIGGACAKPAV